MRSIANQLIQNLNDLAPNYEPHMGRRWFTTKTAINIYLQQGLGLPIVETGCARGENDWGAGMSSVLFGDIAKRLNIQFHTVDITPENIETCKGLTRQFLPNIEYHTSDSVKYLREYNGERIGLLYLDSYDYPYGELLNEYGGREDITAAEKVLRSMPEEEIVSKHGQIIHGAQEHCLQELLASLHCILPQTPILIDDCDLPGGGKGRTAKIWLQENGYTCLLDSYQSLWIKSIP